ncbi:hypothetical protein HYDPIDRAFT_111862 [Hydnomerulius pinastri MD-312]|uniref:VPS37 C-terminal domain-containing protein n=1 Tax=Hydnomerulius pinastri MD-312 TaxID=994086 RepID=A0A0C9WF68_9AGAM|nr:hypothetical protein HYDPIDRAFT_111862 [Hydnomerulius pinastri MD-312]
MAATPLMAEFPELSHLTRNDLEDLLNDPAYFQSVFHSLSSVKSLYQSQSELGTANEAIARTNVSLQGRLYQLRSETQDAFDEAKSLEARWKEVEREQREVYQRFTPQFLLLRLRHATADQDNASEALASSFVQASSSSGLNDASDVDDFVREFRELRKIYHKRVMWGDRWAAGQVMWRDD